MTFFDFLLCLVLTFACAAAQQCVLYLAQAVDEIEPAAANVLAIGLVLLVLMSVSMVLEMPAWASMAAGLLGMAGAFALERRAARRAMVYTGVFSRQTFGPGRR